MMNRQLFSLVKRREWTGLISRYPHFLQSSDHTVCHTGATDSSLVRNSIHSGCLRLSSEDESWLTKKMVNTRIRLGFTERPKPYYRERGRAFFRNIEKINWREYFKTLQMPDTFHSWFLVIELHIWMLCVRANAEGKEGEQVSRFAIECMWDGAQKRAKKLETHSSSALRQSFYILHEEFLAAFTMYDYGLLTSDMLLAEAVWCRFFQEKCEDPEKVELLVKHIRKQIQLLDQISSDTFLKEAAVTWLPLSGKK